MELASGVERGADVITSFLLSITDAVIILPDVLR